MEFLERTINMLGKDKFSKIQNAKIIIIGVGGVGGYVLEMLVRTGIENIDLVDFDKIEATNINRQIITTQENVGNYKVEEAKKRALQINPRCNIKSLVEKVSISNLHKFNLHNYSYVIDCIDIVEDKMDLIEYCYKNNIKIISSMGTGNKFGIPSYQIADIYKTEYDKLAKVIRKKCKERQIKKLTVCYSKEKCMPNQKVSSVAYQPASCGIIIASYIINELIKG